MKELSLRSCDDFEQVLELYNKMIYRLAYARTGNVHDAEDITQEVFFRYIKANKVFNDEEHRKAWFLKVTVNCTKSSAVSSWNKHRAEDIDSAVIGREDPHLKDVENENAVLKAVRSLPEKYRVAVHLFYFEELSVEEISGITGIGANTVKVQLHRARTMLKEILKEDLYD